MAGAGHLLPLALVVLPVLLLRLELPGSLEHVVDLGVGVLLGALGVRTLWRLRREQLHVHAHAHDGDAHTHFHGHGDTVLHGHAHVAPVRDGRGWITFGIGMVHGLAGSGAAAVLALASAPSVAAGAGYLLEFGVGTCVGMFAATLCVAAPALSAVARFGRLRMSLRLAAGVASIVVGVLMWV